MLMIWLLPVDLKSKSPANVSLQLLVFRRHTILVAFGCVARSILQFKALWRYLVMSLHNESCDMMKLDELGPTSKVPLVWEI